MLINTLKALKGSQACVKSLNGIFDVIGLIQISDDVIRYYVIAIFSTYTSRSIPLLSFSLDVDLLDEYSIKISVTSFVFSEKYL